MGISSIVPTSTLMAPTDFSANLSPDSLMVYLSTRLNGLDEQINTVFNTEKQRDAVQSALRKVTTAVSEFDENAADNTTVDSTKLADVQKALDELKQVDPELGAKVEKDLGGDGYLLHLETTSTASDASTDPPSETPHADGQWIGFDYVFDGSTYHPGDTLPTGEKVPVPVAGEAWQPTSPNGLIPPQPPLATNTSGNPTSSTGNQQFSGIEVKATTEYLQGLTKDLESASQMDMIRLQSLMSSRQTAIQLATNMISALGESSKAIAANIGR